MEFAKQHPHIRDVNQYIEEYKSFISDKHDEILQAFHSDLDFPASSHDKE